MRTDLPMVAVPNRDRHGRDLLELVGALSSLLLFFPVIPLQAVEALNQRNPEKRKGRQYRSLFRSYRWLGLL
jgi:hypothetical protein